MAVSESRSMSSSSASVASGENARGSGSTSAVPAKQTTSDAKLLNGDWVLGVMCSGLGVLMVWV
jgi:hypothetical protein